MRGADVRCTGHGWMLGICVLKGVGAHGVLGGGEAVGALGCKGGVGTGTLGGRAERPNQWVIGGVVG